MGTPPVQPLSPAQTALQEARAAKEGYLRRLPVAVDIFLDELAGSPMDETISTRWGIAALKGNKLAAFGCKVLNLFQPNHDAKAASGDDERAAHLRELLQLSGIISPK